MSLFRRAVLLLALCLWAATAQGQVTVRIMDANPVLETDTGMTQLAFDVELIVAMMDTRKKIPPYDINFTTRDGSATAGDNDYQPQTMGVLTFAGSGVETQTIVVQVNGDDIVEGDETLFVDITPADPTVMVLDSEGQGTITNDDATTLSIDDVAVTEGNSGGTAADFTVSLSAPSDFPVTVDFAPRDSSATMADSDYSLAGGMLTFAPRQVNQTVSATVNGDLTVEGDEIFFVDLSNPAGATITDSEGQGTITNDDSTDLSIDDVMVTEGDSGTVAADFTVTLSNPSAFAVSVNYAGRDGSATVADSDYSLAAGSLNFLPGQQSLTVSATINGDTTAEGDESFFVDLSSPNGAGLADPEGEGTILGDDGATLAIDDVTVTEGDAGTTDAIFTVSLSNPSALPVSVDFATRDGTATVADGDYSAAAGTLNFAPATLSQTLTVTVAGDLTVEGNESYFVDLTNPVGATLADPEGEGAITGDDGTALSIDDVTVAEGDSGTTAAVFTVSLSNPSALPVSVDFATRDGTATAGDGDFNAGFGTLNFGAGQLTQTLTVDVRGDSRVEADEGFFVDLTNPVGAALGDPEGSGSISNDDSTELSIAGVTVTEGNSGTVSAVFTVGLSNRSDFPVGVDFSTRDGSATTADSDYSSTSGKLAFAPRQLTQTLTVLVIGDTRVEGDESFFVDLSNPSGASIATGPGEGVIRGDDSTALSIDDVRVTEGDSGSTDATFTVSLSSPSDSAVSVDYRTRNGSATIADDDYTASSGTLTFSPGQLTLGITVAVRGDTAIEPDETFFVDLSSASGAALADSRGIGTILNDDDEPSVVRLVSAPASSESSGSAVVQAERTGSGEGPATVRVRAASGTATAGEDFAALSEVLSWSAGETGIKQVEIELLDDNLVEGDETAVLRLTDPSGVSLGSPSELDLVILDDDVPAALESVGDTEIAAGVGEEVELTIRIANAAGAPVQGARVSWEVEGDAELTDGETTESDADGIASQRVAIGEMPGLVTVRARLSPAGGARATESAATEQAGVDIVFEIAVEGDLDELFDEQNDPGGTSFAGAVNRACGADQGGLTDLCGYLFALDEDEQRAAIEALIPREAGTQGDFSLNAPQIQLRNIGSRLAALRGSATGQATAQLAVVIRDRPVPMGMLQAAIRLGASEERRFLDRVESALLAGLQPPERDDDASAAEPDIDEPSRWGLFVNGRVSMGDRPATLREEGFDFETQGLTAGVDVRLNEHTVLGGAVGYLTVDTDLAGDGGSLDVDGVAFSLYSTYFAGPFYADGVISYGRNDYEFLRVIDLPSPLNGASRLEARGNPGGSQLLAAINAGYDTSIGAVGIGGFGRLSWIDGEVDGYAEIGAGSLNLAIEAQSVESLLLEGGVEIYRPASTSWGVLQPTLRVSLLHEFEDGSRLIRGRFVNDRDANQFALPTDAPDRNYFNLGLGMTATLPRGRSAFLFYDTDLEREDLDIYTLTAGFRLEF